MFCCLAVLSVTFAECGGEGEGGLSLEGPTPVSTRPGDNNKSCQLSILPRQHRTLIARSSPPIVSNPFSPVRTRETGRFRPSGNRNPVIEPGNPKRRTRPSDVDRAQVLCLNGDQTTRPKGGTAALWSRSSPRPVLDTTTITHRSPIGANTPPEKRPREVCAFRPS